MDHYSGEKKRSAPQDKPMPPWKAELYRKVEVRRNHPAEALLDLGAFLLALLFAGQHVVFGTYPLAIGWLSVLPDRIFVSLVGGILGALLLGKDGVIYALILLLTVFLRIVISGGGSAAAQTGENGADTRGGLFCESLSLRVSSAVIGGFVAAAYEILQNGFTLASAAFGVSSILIPAGTAVLFYGLFVAGISAGDLLFGEKNLFPSRYREEDRDRFFACLYYRVSLAFLLFLTAYSLHRAVLFGVHFSYVFCGVATLVLAKRFGPIYGLAAGFLSSVGLSAPLSVAFALAGIAAGLLYAVSPLYAMTGGGLLLSLWAGYAGRLEGLLSVLPEYLIAACLTYPLLRYTPKEPSEKVEENREQATSDMVGTMALSYRKKQDSSITPFLTSLAMLAPMVRRFSEGEEKPTFEEYRQICLDCGEHICKTCPGYRACLEGDAMAFRETANIVADKLMHAEPIRPEDISDAPIFCPHVADMTEGVRHAAARLEEEKYRSRHLDLFAEDCEILAKLVSEVKENGDKRFITDEKLTEKLKEVFRQKGFSTGSVAVFGDRRKYVIAAGIDESGDRISDEGVLRAFEKEAGIRLSPPDFCRRGDAVAFECYAEAAYDVEYGYSSVAGKEEEVSGDSVSCFISKDRIFYAVLSDGMGTGETAGAASRFTAEYLSAMLDSGVSPAGALGLLNRILRRRSEECSATVDIFCFDLITGEGTFIKCGAAASYIKRTDRLFRLRSETVPLGLLRNMDAERIRAEVQDADTVVMMSDGVCQAPEESPAFIEALNRKSEKTPKEYAAYLLDLAERRDDDRTVIVIRIGKKTA